MTDPTKENRRLIYGRRQGRPIRGPARNAFDTALPRLALKLDNLADLPRLFPGARDFALEVGFGGGEHLAAQAIAHPETGYLGAEPFVNGVANLAHIARDLANVRILHGDARDVLDGLPDASLAAVFVLFPDPWPKARHHKRRFISQDNLTQIARVLKPCGKLRVASDITDYVRWTLVEIAVFNRAVRRFAWTARAAEDWRARPADWPGTRYEAKALVAGRAPAYLEFARL